ncbi:hypothetical protein AUR64_15905 [Haloprofundus marisrubri]|uniref:Uncharacterized protein n=1 Tax=Haloprofundus marisrubri TaxID=1514971 RepID=A0A0W1R6W5_9EURY|nr:hypothetical protein [Haloprofundus marisrubri]KTG09270.1 hypothetical protein AUR64_15905 [Haloprofundus marisrubri]
MYSHLRSKASYGLAVGLIVAVPLTLELLFGHLLDEVVAGGQFPWWLPEFGTTIGQTASTYLLLLDALTYLGVPAVVFALGVHYATMKQNT